MPDAISGEYVAPFGNFYPPDAEELLNESWEIYNNRPEREEYPEKTVPEGWPSQHPPSPLLWNTDTFPKDGSQFVDLSDADVTEVEEALKFVEETSLDPSDIVRSTFPLPNLGLRLDEACKSVHFGLGVCIVRGLPKYKYTPEQNVKVLAGISSYFGETRGRQRDDGSKLIHIFNSTTRISSTNRAPIFASYAQAFHNDICTDILCMYCLSPASDSGGSNSFASIPTLYNILAKTEPEVIHTLAAPDWPFDTYGYNPPYHYRPLMFWQEPGAESDDDDDKTEDGRGVIPGRLITSLSPRQLRGTISQPRHPSLPKLTDRQQHALDTIERLAKENCITYTLAAGEMVFVNNLAVLHNRSGYVDSPEIPANRHRHLIRMFLRNEELAWETPRQLVQDWMRVFGGFEEDDDLWVSDPVKDYKEQQGGRWEVSGGGLAKG